MPLYTSDEPYGDPAFELSKDQIATIIDLLCRGTHYARSYMVSGMTEPRMTRIVRKAIKRVKRELGLTNIEIYGEQELDDMATTDPTIRGRIDIFLKFLQQFGDEDSYVAVECKRVRPHDATLNAKYVSQGVHRFVTGQYADGHEWGFMLGYMLALPVSPVIAYIDLKTRKNYGKSAALRMAPVHQQSLAVLVNTLAQSRRHRIKLKHIFVDMLPAGP